MPPAAAAGPPAAAAAELADQVLLGPALPGSRRCCWRHEALPAPSSAGPALTPSAHARGVGLTRYCLHRAADGDHLGHAGHVPAGAGAAPSRRTRAPAIGLVLAGSMGRAISMTSPMIELMGPICMACTPAGRARAPASRRSPRSGGCGRRRCPNRTPHRRRTGRHQNTERTRLTPGMPFMACSSGKRDELLDLFRGHAAGFGEQGHLRACPGRGRRRPACRKRSACVRPSSATRKAAPTSAASAGS
jgi:hypothetical protein